MRAAIGRVLFFAALALIATLLVWVRDRDGPPPDDTDLMAEPAAPADHENAFLTLTASAALLDWPTDDAEATRLREMASGDGWDESLAASALVANERALETFARAADQPGFRSPDREPRPEQAAWMDLARLQGVRAIARARRGDADGAIAQALLCLRVANTIATDSNASRIVALVATTIGESGLDALRTTFGLVVVPPEQSREVTVQLSGMIPPPDSWRRLLAAEYREIAPTIPTGRLSVRVPEGAPGLRLLASLLPSSHLYQPNNTRAAYANAVRSVQAGADAPCLTLVGVPKAALRSLLRPNLAGRQLLGGPLNPASSDRARCRFNTRIDALRGVIGVQAFERERGVLPASLEELVPDYLSASPSDWFFGSASGGRNALELDAVARELVSYGFWDASGDSPNAAREERFPLLPRPSLRSAGR